jgi:hypothetical protein
VSSLARESFVDGFQGEVDVADEFVPDTAKLPKRASIGVGNLSPRSRHHCKRYLAVERKSKKCNRCPLILLTCIAES